MFNLTQLNMTQLNKIRYLWQALLSLSGALLILSSCEVDDFTEEVTNTISPTVAITLPTEDTVSAEVGFTIAAEFSDETPGLGLATYDILDSLGNVVLSNSYKLVGTSNSIEFELEPDTLAFGNYTFRATVTDTEGNFANTTKNFFAGPILRAQEEMYLFGSFNGGSIGLPMKIVDNYIWQVPVRLEASDNFRFANTTDDSNLNWGDSGCDDQSSESENSIDCGFEGNLLITFNDLDLSYEIIELESAFPEMYLVGSFDNWGAPPDLPMTLVEDFIWEIEHTFEDDHEFKFVTTPDFSNPGEDWGDVDCNGIGDQVDNNNIRAADCNYSGTRILQFNDKTLEYTVN